MRKLPTFKELFKLSDLFFLIGFLPFAVIIIIGQVYMQITDPDVIGFPLWVSIPCLVIMVGGWGVYLYLELFKKKDDKQKFNLVVGGICAFLILLNIIIILVQPKVITETVIIRFSKDHPELVGTTSDAIIPVSAIHKFMFIAEIIGVIMFVYIGLFIFPKRIKSVIFIKYLGFALFLFLTVLIIYGYIADFDKYVAFFKHVFLNDRTDPDIYHKCVTSFIINRNAYGMCMMLGIIFAFIVHSIHRKWFYYLVAGFCFVNMIFSLCKTGIIISVIIMLVYVGYRLITTFKEHKKRNLIILISFGSVALAIFTVIAASIISKGKFLSPIYSLYDELVRGGSSLDARTYIWDNTYQLLRDGNWLIGRGFGIINLALQPMNIISHEEKVFPTHSAYLSLVGEGGILFLLAYLALLVYSGYVIVKCFKKQPGLTLAMSLGVVSFVLYSFIETIHYLVYIFLFPIMVLYFSLQKEEKQIN